jgi:TonB-dependent starch-binding outer membrane protein SusC
MENNLKNGSCSWERILKKRFLLLRFLMFLVFLSTVVLSAQEGTRRISGSVKTAKNEPLPGVTVKVKESMSGTNTDQAGNFVLNVDATARTLVFSFIGMSPMEVEIGNKDRFDIVMEESAVKLDEVVVVGYGTLKKSDVTGALTSINEKTLSERPVQNVVQALQGKASGIDVTTNIKPGELPPIIIRGNRSIQASNAPLYVVDGIPLAIGNMSDFNPNDIFSVEILKDASATAIYGSRGANGIILITTKKGSAGKININYNATVSLDSYHNMTKWMNGGEYVDRWRLSLMNGRLYNATTNTDLKVPATLWYPDPFLDNTKFSLASDPVAQQSVWMGYEWVDGVLGGTPVTRATTPEEQALGWPAQVPVYNSANVRNYNWRNDALRQGITQNHQISLSKGDQFSHLYMSLAYLGQVGVQKDQDYKRFNVIVNGDINPVKWLSMGTSINASRSIQNFGIQGPNTSNTGSKDLYSRATDQFPYALPKKADGTYIYNPGGNLSLWNPLIDIDQSINERSIYAIYSNMFGEVKFTPWLRYRLNVGAQFRQYRSGGWTGPLATSHLTNKPNTAGYNTTQNYAWVAENLLYIDKTFADVHTIGVTLLQSTQKSRQEGINISASSMIYDISKWYDIASNLVGKPDNYGTSYTENSLMSYMARVNYTLMNKYLLTASGRWDGASVLAPGHKWEFFPSFALAWKMQEESFMKGFTWLNEFKLRFGYGITGNSSVSPYSTSGPLSKNPYVFGSTAAVGYLPQIVPNPLLTWEKTAQSNLGLDFGFLKRRITGTIELYQSNTSDLLLDKTLPAVSGFVSKVQNIGKTRNRGIEITLSTVNMRKGDFTWSTDLNFYANKEEIQELLSKDANGKPLDILANRWFIGYPIQVYYNYQKAGIWQNTPEDLAEMAKFNANGHKFYPGTIKVVDQLTVDSDGDGIKDATDYKITGDDMVILGTNRPKWTGGVTNTFNYKDFEFSFFVYARIGQMYFGGYPNSYGGVNPNGRVENNMWSWDNPGGYWPMPNSGTVENFTPAMNYNDGSYVSVRNISLSYSLPAKWLKKLTMNNLQLSCQVVNPFMFGGDLVKWGINPEDNTNWDVVSSNGGPLGGMNNNTILVQSIVFGIKAGF